ncbi:MAG TPA: LamG domain-containing protein, partial [Longimicrobium sp.]|nr:LamG domain-containing protein [Longimicrobium sp.]
MTLTTGLELHLKLDDVGTQAADSSGKGRNGTVSGTVAPVWDATFGRCARFDGSGGYLSVTDPFTAPGAFTVALWVMPDPTNGASVGLIGKHGDAQPKPSLAFSGRGLKYASAASTGGTQFGGTLADFYPAESEWVHVAWVKEGTAYRFYRNAALVDTKTAPAQVFTSATTPWWIGKDGGPGQTGSFRGRIAAVRVYSRALTQAELWEVTEVDRVVPFRATHPIGFELLDENDQNALYIENPQSGKTHEVDLVIRNTSGGPVYLQPLGVAAPTALEHHFELRFRPGVLGPMAMQGLTLSGDAQWSASAPQTTADGVSVYLMRADGAAAWAMAAGSAVTLKLTPLCAAAEGGTRGTRVELRTRSVTDGPSAASPIDETRTLPVSIINHLGVKNLPLHAGLAGPGTVLNDGSTANTLTLRITNTLPANGTYPEQSRVELSTATRLVLTAEGASTADSANAPWALAKISELDSVEVGVSHSPGVEGGSWTDTRNPLGTSPEWTLRPQARVVLDGREYLDITLSGLKSSLPPGVAYLTVHYENVPGYWDGQWVLPVEKSLVYAAATGVGVGTST